MTPETPDHKEMPLTLAFKPDTGHEDETELEAIALVQPSMDEEGRIFVAINPFGKPLGVHMIPEEARRVRDHLSMLLLEPEEETDVPNVSAKVAAAVKAMKENERVGEPPRPPTPEEVLAAGHRRQTAPSRPPRVRGRFLPQFRLEFVWGKFQAIFERRND